MAKPKQEAQSIISFGIQRVAPQRYLAVRLESGKRTVITPGRFRDPEHGESKALAVQRVLEEIRLHVKRGDV